MRQLAEHVANSNLAARRCFAELKTLLGERLGGPGGELSACLDRLDFDGAGAPLATIVGVSRTNAAWLAQEGGLGRPRVSTPCGASTPACGSGGPPR